MYIAKLVETWLAQGWATGFPSGQPAWVGYNICLVAKCSGVVADFVSMVDGYSCRVQSCHGWCLICLVVCALQCTRLGSSQSPQNVKHRSPDKFPLIFPLDQTSAPPSVTTIGIALQQGRVPVRRSGLILTNGNWAFRNPACGAWWRLHSARICLFKHPWRKQRLVLAWKGDGL